MYRTKPTAAFLDGERWSEEGPTLKLDNGSGGWKIDYKQVSKIAKQVEREGEESVSLEQTEAVLCALISLGYLPKSSPRIDCTPPETKDKGEL